MKKLLLMLAAIAFIAVGCTKDPVEPETPNQDGTEQTPGTGDNGDGSGDEPGGEDPGENPGGEEPGENPGENPGEEPGDDPVVTPDPETGVTYTVTVPVGTYV